MPNKNNIKIQSFSGNRLDLLLEKAFIMKSRINIQFDFIKIILSSSIRKIDEKHIFLNEIEPESDVKALVLPVKAKVSFLFEDKGMMHFDTVLFYDGTVSALYYLDKPTAIINPERRKYFRVKPPSELPATCLSIGKSKTAGVVIVENISLQGISLSFPSKSTITIGTTMKNICLKLVDREITLDVVIQNSFPGPKGRFCIGFKWVGLKKEHEKIISDFVIAAQRAIAQKKL